MTSKAKKNDSSFGPEKESGAPNEANTTKNDMAQRIKPPTLIPKPNTGHIVEAVEMLQQRKAKPDTGKISSYIAKNWPNAYEEDPKIVEDLINECLSHGMIVLVNNLESISFRTPAKIGRMLRVTKIIPYGGQIPRAVVLLVMQHMADLECAAKDSNEEGAGVSVQELLRHLHDKLLLLNYNEEILEKKLLPIAINHGHAKKMYDGLYTLTQSYRETYKIKLKPANSAEEQVEQLDTLSNSTIDNKSNNTSPEPTNRSIKRSRNFNPVVDIDESSNEKNKDMNNSPDDLKNDSKDTSLPQRVSTRKKFKKSHGPDFVESNDQLMSYLRVSTFIYKCSMCNGPISKNKQASANRNKGRSQSPDSDNNELGFIQCHTCEHSLVHLSCLKVTKHIGLRNQWRCSSCANCSICYMPRKKEFIIICNKCHLGYHINCTSSIKSNDSDHPWECQKCSQKTDSSILLTRNSNVNPINTSSTSISIDTSKPRLVTKLNTRQVMLKSNSLLQSNNVDTSSNNASSSSSNSLLLHNKCSLSNVNTGQILLKSLTDSNELVKNGNTSLNGEQKGKKILLNSSTKTILDVPEVRNYLMGNNDQANGNRRDPNIELIELKDNDDDDEQAENSVEEKSNQMESPERKASIENNLPTNKIKKRDRSYLNILKRKNDFEIKRNFFCWVEKELSPFMKDLDLSSLSTLPNNINKWDVNHVHTFISTVGFKNEADMMLKHEIDGPVLLLLKREDILRHLDIKTGPGLKIHSLLVRLHESF